MGEFFHTPLKIDFMTKNYFKKLVFLDTFGKTSIFLQKYEKFTKSSHYFQQSGQK